MRILISSDHGGYELKEYIKKYLSEKDYEVEDKGPKDYEAEDDYPDYVPQVAGSVTQSNDTIGVLICRNGVGVCVAANKFHGVRAALSFDPMHAESARRDDDANILCLGADYISEEKAVEMVQSFIDTPFSGEARHVRRLEKVSELEKK